jgi:Rrf2 family protein
MRISTKGRYSLEALLYIALLPKGCSANTKTISGQTGVTEGYLEQLFIHLRKDALISSTRGPNGGYVLGRPAEEISVGAVLRATEGDLKLVECVDANRCPMEEGCENRRTWQTLYKGINDFIDSISMADLVAEYNTIDGPEYTI